MGSGMDGCPKMIAAHVRSIFFRLEAFRRVAAEEPLKDTERLTPSRSANRCPCNAGRTG